MNLFLISSFLFCWVVGRTVGRRPEGFEQHVVVLFLMGWMLFSLLFLQWRVFYDGGY